MHTRRHSSKRLHVSLRVNADLQQPLTLDFALALPFTHLQICAYTILDVVSKVLVSFMVMSGHDILREGPGASKEFF